MLKLILGRINSGKTTLVQNRIKNLVESGKDNIYLIVPDQFSFASEKNIITLLGEKQAMKVEVCGFSRLAENAIGETKGVRHLDDAGRVALMSIALEQVADKLCIYGRFARSAAVISEMLKISDEFKKCSVAPEDLEKSARKLPDGMLRKKLLDLSLITAAFDALVSQQFTDDRDTLTLFARKLEDEHYFNGATVFIDGFKGFTAQETDVISRMIAQSENVYITLCTDKVYTDGFDVSAFACVRDTARKLIDIAKKNGAAAGFESPPEYSGRYASKALETLEKSLYSTNPEVYMGNAEEVCIFTARTAYEECDYVALTVKRLLREENYRCRDIAIISRSEGEYSKALRSTLKRHGVPVFEDKRKPLTVYPPVVLVRAAAEIAAKGFNTDAVFRLLKTQLTELSVEETSELEEYVYLWQLDGKKWLVNWSFNPSGMGNAESEKDRERLEYINSLRKRVVQPLECMCERVKNAYTAEQKLSAIYKFLTEIKVPENLKKLARELDRSGETAEAMELGRVWDKLMEIFDQLAVSLGEAAVTSARLAELFNLVLGVQDMGVIPGGIDEITIGSADRIRVNRPRAVFAVGVNDGVFPKKPSSGRVLGDSDRRILTEMGLRVAEPSQYTFFEERHLAYNALCCASERLWLTFCKTDFSGNDSAPSELITKVHSCLPQCAVKDITSCSELELIESEASAFELAAKGWNTKSTLESTLKYCFDGRANYADRMSALDRTGNAESIRIADKKIASDLFGSNINVSATRVEDFNKCPFLYFCRYGLKLNERKKAEIDSALGGTVVHYVLENLVSKYGKKLIELNKDSLVEEIKYLLDDFLAESMGGAEEKDARFVFLYERLCDSLCVVAQRLINEMKLSDFEPADFELQIGGSEPQIPAYELDLPDGSKVILSGKVDRVDILRTEDRTFVRVMDYKTGSKKFNLNDVLHGLNMQMLLYLFAIRANGKERYGNVVPAGVLYVPAKSKDEKLERFIGEDVILQKVITDGRMSGLVLDDDRVIYSTDTQCTGTVIAGRNSMADSLVTLEQFGQLEKIICDSVIAMGVKLHDGMIAPHPVFGGTYKLQCEYCAYSSICLHEGDSAENEYEKMSHKECLAVLTKDGEEDA